LPEQPDLNFRSPLVKKEIEDVIKFWLETKNIDGLRIDALANLYENIDFKDEPIAPGINVDLEVHKKFLFFFNFHFFNKHNF